MRVSVLINNHNYAGFVGEAVASALEQSRPPDEIIVVDDGSSDGSKEILSSLAADDSRVHPHFQDNRGQLAAMEAAVSRATGELLFFLDSDDRYERDHVEKAVAAFEENTDLGFYFSDHRQSSGPKTCPNVWGEGYLGPSAYLTRLSGARIGSITSPLVLHRRIADLLFPFDPSFHNDWRIRADDCLIWGASLAGASKYFYPEETIFYRIHDSNHFTQRQQSEYKDYVYDLRKGRLLDYLARRFGLRAETAGRQLVKEFRLNPAPNYVTYRRYMKSVRAAPISFARKLRFYRQLSDHYRRNGDPAQRRGIMF